MEGARSGRGEERKGRGVEGTRSGRGEEWKGRGVEGVRRISTGTITKMEVDKD